ncbi:probable L-type lectin-domain containing receptor kinase S.7 [Ipomoea triloba]|uniref:probable L-type lectin-domain containing receptor kinase S.7 n=1 Tax=Ipomoea triloba TaxID=35885 RepID=UPI00125E6537|nr:probable L-type lectin-domain containing receptor kinase S.7 [Ipomoea triloba]
MEMRSRNLFLYSLFLLLFNPTVSQNFTFDFPSFNPTNLTLLGDSHVKDGVLSLTRRSRAPSSSSGSALYKNPIRFFDKHAASFSTRFTFRIESVNAWSSGGGFSFFLSPENHTLGSPGGFLGLMDSTQITKNRFVAVEFDTEQDLQFDDPDENHVGLDIDTIVSVKTGSAMPGGINLKSGFSTTAWIDYYSPEKIEVFLSYSTLKPQTPVMEVEIDLSGYLNDSMFLGFSASAERSTEQHFIHNWSFQISGITAPAPTIHSHNLDSDSPVPGRQQFQVFLILVLGICGAAFVCAVLLVFWWSSMKKTKQEVANTVDDAAEAVAESCRQFSYKELRSATRGFSSKNIIGQGALGTVYKACFRGSDNIAAVKRLKHSRAEFVAELSTIARLSHRNLLRLQGWCAEKGEFLVVYDYMPNGSLDKALYRETGEETSLKWPHRYNIAVGLASVLTYLHQEQESNQQVIHSDLKPSNVMLDSSYTPRLGDFGLSWLMDHDKNPTGTMGYVAPEYVLYGQATEESDVYSYGVVALEVACGRRPGKGKKMEGLVDWVWRLHYEGRIIEAADRRLNGEFSEDEMRKVLLVGLSCANPDSTERPSMKRVLQTLMNEVETMVVPRIKPTLTFSNTLLLRTNEILSDDEKSGFLEINLRSDSIEEERDVAV